MTEMPEELEKGDSVEISYERGRNNNIVEKSGEVKEIDYEDEEVKEFVIVSDQDSNQLIRVHTVFEIRATSYRTDSASARTTTLGIVQDIEVKSDE